MDYKKTMNLGIRYLALTTASAYAVAIAYYFIHGSFDFNILGIRIRMWGDQKSILLFFLFMCIYLLTKPKALAFPRQIVKSWINKFWKSVSFLNDKASYRSIIDSTPHISSGMALLFFLAIGLFFRTWGLYFPGIHFDGVKLANATLHYLNWDYTWDLGLDNLHFLGYPYFLSHIYEWLIRIYLMIEDHLGNHEYTSNADIIASIRIMARWLNVIFQAIIIYLFYVIGKRLFSRWAGVASAAIISLSILHIQTTHIINADIFMLMFGLVSIYFSVKLGEEEKLKYYFLAGIFAGLSAAAKYNGVFTMLFGIMIFAELRIKDKNIIREFGLNFKRAVTTVLGFFVTFILATPSIIISPLRQIDAIMRALEYSAVAHVSSAHKADPLLALYELAPSHYQKLVESFAPLPVSIVAIAIIYYWARFGFSKSYLWIFPTILFIYGCYAMPASSAYHFFIVLTPIFWIVGKVFADIYQRARKPLHRALVTGSLAILFASSVYSAASDTSMYDLPANPPLLADEYYRELAETRQINVERIWDGKPANAFADFDMGSIYSKRHSGGRYLLWADGKTRDISFFPLPRREDSAPVKFIFPDNLHFSRYPGLIDMNRNKEYKRIIRVSKNKSWLLYARNVSADEAELKVTAPGIDESFTLKPGSEIFHEFNLEPDFFHLTLFSTLNLKSSERGVVMLCTGDERGWFYYKMKRWKDLYKWETVRDRNNFGSLARKAIAAKHLGLNDGDKDKLAKILRNKSSGNELPDYNKLFLDFSDGIGMEYFEDPHPAMLSSFSLRFWLAGKMGKIIHWRKREAEEGALYIRDGERFYGPHASFLPGKYRATFRLKGSAGIGKLKLKLTSDSGEIVLAERNVEIPAGALSLSLPFHITREHHGWNTEFTIEHRGGDPVEIYQINVGNDVQGDISSWFNEVKSVF